MLAFYAQITAQKPSWEKQLYTPPGEAEEILQALINRRSQLIDMRTAEKNRLEQVHESQKKSIEKLIAHFDKLIKALDKEISSHSDRHFGEKRELMQRIKGVGSTTAATLCAMLPELGTVSHKQIASLVGVAPYPQESGTMKFKSRCFGGRGTVRNILYMAALVAANHEPGIKAFYQRLRAKGKPHKVALTACVHKLLTILNPRMREHLAASNPTAETASAAA